MSQSLMVFLVTLVATMIAGLCFMFFSNFFHPGRFSRDEFAIIHDNKIIYSTVHLSNSETIELFMNLNIEKENFIHGGIHYRILSEETPDYTAIRFVPVIRPDGGFIPFVIFTSTVFMMVFAGGSFITQRRNYENIIAPVISLKKQTEGIRQGDIDTVVLTNGIGELGELAGAVENLRVELKNSVYYRQKVDDNRKFLISSISHDLKTPVTSIRGYIDGVLDGVADTDKKKEEYLKKAIVKITHMNTMIDDLLLYSKLDLNQMTFDTRRIAINDYIQNLTNEYAVDFEREGKTLSFEDTMKKEVYVRIDGEKMRRAVQNIFDNAKKNIEKGDGWLKTILRESSAAVLIEFTDNGTGIQAKDLPHLFERFYRGDEARTADGSGGLGLAIAKQMIEGMGGRIWAISKDNEGASFIISLKKEMS